MSAVPSATNDSAGNPHRIRSGFISLTESLLNSICEVFPECEGTQLTLQLFQRLVKGKEDAEDKFIRKCHKTFQENGDDIKAKDPGALFAICGDISILKEVGIEEKWKDPDFSEDSKEHLWQYIFSLRTCSDLYCAVPTRVMGKIETIASGLGEQLRSGNLDLKSMDVSALGKDLVATLSADELAQFEGNLPSIYDSIGEVANAMSRQSGGGNIDMEALMKQVAELQKSSEKEGGSVNLEQLVRQVGGSIAPHLMSAEGDAARVGDMMQLMQQATRDFSASDVLPALGDVEAEGAYPKARSKKKKKSRNR